MNPPAEERKIPVRLDILELVFNELQGTIKEILFKLSATDRLVLGNGFLLGDADWTFRKVNSAANKVVFVYEDSQKRITKTFIFNRLNYKLGLAVEVKNLSNLPLTLELPLILGILDFSSDPSQTPYLNVAVGLEDKTSHFNGRKNLVLENARFLALRNKYYCAIIGAEKNFYPVFVEKLNAQKTEVGLKLIQPPLLSNQTWSENFTIYLGPQELNLINNVNPSWSGIIHFGTFDIISQILLAFLEFLHRIVHNWGLAIILLSSIIYFLLFPLTLKQMRSMKQMQILQPRMEALKKLYKDSPQKLNKEIMELYKEHKANPLGGCLPMVLQIPIFFALYQALARTTALKGAKFLWIKDLSQPDRLFTLPFNLPFLGNAFNILPILMAIGMFIQQKSTSASSAGVSSEQQKMMLILFPVLFGFIFYNMPSGLVLYWFTNSIFTATFQIRMNKARA